MLTEADMPLVSVVMPNFNSERHIEAAIRSVLGQTYKNFELIIIDDSSSDSSPSIISEFAESDKRIIAFYRKTNQGAAKCRNLGIDNARGQFIAFLDSDDCWMPTKLECQVRFSLSNACEFVYSAYDVISNTGEYLHTLNSPPKIKKTTLLFSNFIGCSTVMISRSLISETRQRDIYCRNDYMFWIDLLRAGHVARRCPGVLSNYRKGSGLSSNRLINFKFHILAYDKKN